MAPSVVVREDLVEARCASISLVQATMSSRTNKEPMGSPMLFRNSERN